MEMPPVPQPEEVPVASLSEEPAAPVPLSAAEVAQMGHPMMTTPVNLAQYGALGALPYATQQTALLNGASYSTAMAQRMEGLQSADLSAYGASFSAAHMAQYQQALAGGGYASDPSKMMKSRNMYAQGGHNPNQRHGRWTEEEHAQFLELMGKYGRSWTKISQVMLTRSEPQVRSHAQKHFLRVNRLEKQANGEDDKGDKRGSDALCGVDGDKAKKAKRKRIESGQLGLNMLGHLDPSNHALLSMANAGAGGVAGGIPSSLLTQSMALSGAGASQYATAAGQYGSAATFLQNVHAPYTLQQLQQASASTAGAYYNYVMPVAALGSAPAASGGVPSAALADGVSAAAVSTSQSPWMTMTANGAMYTSVPATMAHQDVGSTGVDPAALQAAAVQAAAAAYGVATTNQAAHHDGYGVAPEHGSLAPPAYDMSGIDGGVAATSLAALADPQAYLSSLSSGVVAPSVPAQYPQSDPATEAADTAAQSALEDVANHAALAAAQLISPEHGGAPDPDDDVEA